MKSKEIKADDIGGKSISSTDTAPLMIIIIDLNDVVIDINFTGGGFTKADVIGASAFNFVATEYHTLVKTTHQKVIETRQQLSYETISHGLDGISRWFLTHVNPIINKDVVTGLTLITRDITDSKSTLSELKASEEKLQKSEDNLRTVFENTSIGYVLLNTNLKVIAFNQPAKKMTLDVHQKEIVLETFLYDYFPKENLDALKQVWTKALNGETVEYERKIILANGDSKWYHINYSPVLNKQKVVINLIMKMEDITGRKLLHENILFQQEERFQFAIEGSNDGIWDWNIVTSEVFYSPRWKNMLGFEDSEIKNEFSEWLNRLHPDDMEWVLKDVERAVTDKNFNFSIEFRLLCKDGSYKWILARGKVIGWTIGDKPSRMVGTHTDITERIAAEEKIKQSLKEKEILLQEVHHRVKNNLQIISSILNLQAGNVDDEKTIELIRDTQERIMSMSLIHELLYQTKDFTNINFSKYILNITGNLMISYSPDQRIKLNVDAGNIFLDLDRAIPCGLIINELVTNALKYAFPGNRMGEITITLKIINQSIVLSIADNGIGLPTKVDFRNTPSLGLQLVTSLVSQIDGEIELDNSKGTQYTITFTDK